MESGEFSRGRESIRAEEHRPRRQLRVDVQHQQRVGHLFGPLPPEMRNDTAFMDRIHAYLPGWDVPKVRPRPVHRPFRASQRCPGGGVHAAARGSRAATLMGRVHFGGALSGRDQNAVTKTVSGLLKLIQPDRERRSRRRSRMGGAAGAGDAKAGEGAAESGSAPPSSATPNSATAWAPTALSTLSPRRSCRARTALAEIRCPAGQAWASAPAVGARPASSSASR